MAGATSRSISRYSKVERKRRVASGRIPKEKLNANCSTCDGNRSLNRVVRIEETTETVNFLGYKRCRNSRTKVIREEVTNNSLDPTFVGKFILRVAIQWQSRFL